MANPRIVMVLTKDILKPYLDVRVYKEAKTLAQAGFDVIVLCRVYSLADSRLKEQMEGFTIIRQVCPLPDKKEMSRFEKLGHNFKNVRIMAKKIVELKPSMIHAHDLNALLESVLAKRRLKVPLIYDSHEDWPRLEQSKGNNLQYIGALVYEKILLKYVDEVITVNSILAGKFINRGHVTIIQNLPEINSYKADSKKVEEINQKFDLSDKLIIEYHGVLGREKGFDTIIEVTRELVKKYKKLCMLIIGPGYEQFTNKINELGLNKNMIFTGPKEYHEVPNYISVADISYILIPPNSQYIRSSPTKLFEAMFLGKPVIANGEFPEVVKVFGSNTKKYPGILVNYNKSNIVSALDTLLSNEEKRKSMGGFGLDLIKNKYSWEIEGKKLKELYSKLAN